MDVATLRRVDIIFSAIGVLAINVYAQGNSLIDKLGYNISIQNLNRFDSNVLSLSSAVADYDFELYPSLTIRCAVSRRTLIESRYGFGWNNYISSKSLNVDSHHLFIEGAHSITLLLIVPIRYFNCRIFL